MTSTPYKPSQATGDSGSKLAAEFDIAQHPKVRRLSIVPNKTRDSSSMPGRLVFRPPRSPADPGGLVSATTGERCIEAAFRAGYRKAHLAELVGVSWQTVNTWSKGVTPSADNVRRVASVTGCPVEDLLGNPSGGDPKFSAWDDFKKTRDYEGLGPGERRALATIMWPPGKEPTLSAYLVVLQGIRAAADKSG